MKNFPKFRRLSSKKYISALFSEGSSFTIYPLKVVYLRKPVSEIPSTQVLVTVSKKYFKKAVDRNKIKRRIKEAFRLHQRVLMLPETQSYFIIGYIYIGKDIAQYANIEDKLKQSLLRLKKIMAH